MTQREFETAFVGGPGDEFEEKVGSGQALGYRLEAVSFAGTYGSGGIAALTWIPDENGPLQLLGDFIDADEVHFELSRKRSLGYAPALVGALRNTNGHAVFRIVYERVREGVTWPKLLHRNRDFGSFHNEIFGKRTDEATFNAIYYLRSAAVLDSLPLAIDASRIYRRSVAIPRSEVRLGPHLLARHRT